MKHKRFNLKVCALAAIFAGFSTAIVAEQDVTVPTPEEIVAQAADAERSAALLAIAADRSTTIYNLVAIWEPKAADLGYTDGWAADFTTALEAATDQQLLDIQSATSYDGIRAILQGRDAPVSLDGVIGTEALGSLTSDLVYTPVVPCRIFDTRFDVFGPPGGGNPGTILNYQVYGSAATLLPQGHIAGTGCPQPLGASAVEPIAIAANFTVVPYGQGHIRVWPFGSPQPIASFLNYNSTVNSNLANAGVVQTCYLCGPELSVSTWFGSSDSLGDVMGYFYPAVIPANSIGMSELDSGDLESGFGTVSTILATGANYVMAGSFVANATGKCLVNASGQVSQDSTDTDNNTFFRTARQVGVAAPANDNNIGLYTPAIAGRSHSAAVGAHAIWSVTGGTTYQFGCYFDGASSLAGGFVGDLANCRVSWICF